MGKDDINEWYVFFNGKGKEVIEFLIKRKPRKMRAIETQIKEFRDKIKPHKESDEYTKNMGGLQKNMQKKHIENKNLKKKKYICDLGDYQKKQVFK